MSIIYNKNYANIFILFFQLNYKNLVLEGLINLQMIKLSIIINSNYFNINKILYICIGYNKWFKIDNFYWILVVIFIKFPILNLLLVLC